MNSESSDRLDRRRRVFAVLRDALDLPEDDRTAFIAAQCGNDDSLIAEISAMLGAQSGGMLDQGAGEVAARLIEEDAALDDLPQGTRIGNWRIGRRLGSGGMGTVYLAERTGDGYVQQGALKRIKRGMDSSVVLERFRRERRILSTLVHPNIAHLLDGGIDDDGRPFFVMEYVPGETLRQWIATARPALDARIAVFLEACAAIAHAHHALIVHRDIKPENVLVDANGHARLLDFGIAKLLLDDADPSVTAAQFVSRAYAAPEQLSGDEVTTSTDIFQLGALLFELLSGARFETGSGGSLSGRLARAHANADPTTRPLVAARALRGDVDNVVARATHPDRRRRYATVEALVRDVLAWREGRPVAARADTASYRLRRFIGRHRLATAAGAIALSAILAGSILAIWQASRAADEARLARSAQAFLASVFDASAPDAAAGERVTARELLDRGSERIERELADQPRLQGEMLLTLGSLYSQLGQYPQAKRLLESARSRFDLVAARSSSATRVAIELAAVERERGALDEADAGLAAALDSVPNPGLHSRSLAERALLREKQGHIDEALADARAALTIDISRGESASADRLRDQQIEALLLARRGRFDEATRAFEQALASARTVYGEDDTRIAQMRNDYAGALLEKGHADAAERELRPALASRRKRLGEGHPSVAESLQVLGAALRAQGRLDEAQTVLQEALGIQRKVFGNDHAVVANTLNSVGMLSFSRRQPVEAERSFREAASIYAALGQVDTPPAATTSNNHATALIQLGRYDEAEPLSRHALEVHLKLFGEQHPLVMSDLNSIAQLEMRRDRFDRAIEYGRRAARIADSVVREAREGAYVHLSFANVLNRAGRPAEALSEVDRAIAALERLNASDDSRMPTALAMRADALLGLGRADEAAVLAEQSIDQRRQRLPNDVAGLVAGHALLARIADARRAPSVANRERATARTLLASMTTVDPDLRRQLDRR